MSKLIEYAILRLCIKFSDSTIMIVFAVEILVGCIGSLFQ